MSNRSFFLKTGETENKAFDHPLGLKSSLHIGTNVIEAKYMYMGLGYSPRTSPPPSHFPLDISPPRAFLTFEHLPPNEYNVK